MQERSISRDIKFTRNDRDRELHLLERSLQFDLRVGVVEDSQATVRASLSSFGIKGALHNRLRIDPRLDPVERCYTDLRAAGDILLGTIVFDVDSIAYPQPEKIWEEVRTLEDSQAMARSLAVARNIFDKKPLSDWDQELHEVLRLRPQGWLDKVEEHYAMLTGLLERDIYTHDLLPKMNEFLMDDLEFFHGS